MAIRWFIFGVIALLVNSAFAEKAKKNTSTSSSRPVGKSEEGDYIVEKRSDGTVVKYKKKPPTILRERASKDFITNLRVLTFLILNRLRAKALFACEKISTQK